MSRVNLETLIDFMQRKENSDEGEGETDEIDRAEKISKLSDGETNERSMTKCRESAEKVQRRRSNNDNKIKDMMIPMRLKRNMLC